jgi:O-antigen/teichoic acid export membrane protein
MSNKENVTKRVAWITAANLLGFVLSFLTPLLLVRRLSQSDYGVYRQAFQILTTAVGMLNLQVATSAFYFVPRLPEKKIQIFNNILVFYGVAGLLVLIAFFIYPEWTARIFHSQDLVSQVPLIGLAILLWAVSSSLEAIPLALGDARAAAVIIVVSQFTKTILIVSAVLVLPSVRWIIWAAVAQGVLQTLFTFGYIRYSLGAFYLPFDWPLFKAQLKNAIPYGLGGLVQTFQSDLHNYFVSYHFSPAMFAIYAVGCFQFPLLGMLEGSFASVLVPEMSRLEAMKDHRGIVEVWVNSTRKLALVFFPAFACLFVMRNDVITLLFTRKYEAAAPIFAIFSLNILLSITMTGPIIRAFAKLKFFRLKLSLVLFPAVWGALYLGISLAGLAGAVAAIVIIYAFDRLVCTLMIWRTLGLAASDLRRFAPVLKTGLVAAVAGLTVYLVKQPLMGLQPISRLAVCATAFGLVYVLAGLIAGAITREEKTQLMLWWRRYVPLT